MMEKSVEVPLELEVLNDARLTFAVPTPILLYPDFATWFGKGDHQGLKLDSQGLLRASEAIALPGMRFTVLEKLADYILKVKIEGFSSSDPFYVDERFVFSKASLKKKEEKLSKEGVINHLRSLIGAQYIWGGNWSQGVPQMLDFYPPQVDLDEYHRNIWTFKGVDCSGLLYEAMQGKTPRNTSELVHFGIGVEIEGLSINEIQSILRPLDLIVWKGHILIVLDHEDVIESRGGKGVIIHSLEKILKELMLERRPANYWVDGRLEKTFVIRRGLEELF